MWGASIVYELFLANLKESAFNVFTVRKFAWIQYQNQTRLIKNGVASWMNLVKHVLWHRPDWYTILNCFAKEKTIVNKKKHFLLEYISLLQLVVRLSVIAFVFHSFFSICIFSSSNEICHAFYFVIRFHTWFPVLAREEKKITNATTLHDSTFITWIFRLISQIFDEERSYTLTYNWRLTEWNV